MIPLEPTSVSNVEPNTELAAKLVNSALHVGAKLFIHPIQYQDLARDPDPQRQALRSVLISKYLELKNPPAISATLESVIGRAVRGSNDEIDNQLLAAVAANSVSYLVTEDIALLKKATKANLSERVLPLKEALQVLESLYEKTSTPPPAVDSIPAYLLNLDDAIWESFRGDYPGFDQWFKKKVQEEHRPCWIINGGNGYAGVAIIKPEPDFGLLPGRVYKLCSFKVSASHSGLKYGELLLKTVFSYANENNLDWLYVTVFDKQVQLVELFKSFGFQELAHRSAAGELILAKPLHPSASGEQLEGLAFNIRFGPSHLDLNQTSYAIPIKPQYHDILFPELLDQLPLIPGEHPSGNSLRKAYLSRSTITPPAPGSVIAFYRSEDKSAITCIGVVEQTLRSQNPDEIAAFVGTRTVYTYDEIVDMCAHDAVLAILFRQARPLIPPARLEELQANGVLLGPPQSITQLKGEAKTWLKLRLQS